MSLRAASGCGRSSDQNRSIGNDKTSDVIGALIRVDHVNDFVLPYPVHHIIAVDQAESRLTTRNEIGAVTVARRNLNVVVPKFLHEAAQPLIAP